MLEVSLSGTARMGQEQAIDQSGGHDLRCPVFRKVAFTIYLKPLLAAVALLVVGVAASEPAIDDDALKAALEKGAVKIVSVERHLGPPEVPDGAFARACKSWTLTDAQVLSFFKKSTAISPDEMRSTYSVLPCQYSGALTISGTHYQFAINIGRFGFIRGASPQDVALFGCEDACKELFQFVAEGT